MASVSSESGDRGIDVVATRDGAYREKQLVQVKKYSAGNPVGSPEIQQYSSLKHQENEVDAVVVVTTSRFTKQASELAERLNVKLIDGEDLSALIEQLDATELVDRYTADAGDPEFAVETTDAGISVGEDESPEPAESDEMGTADAVTAVARLLLLLGILGYLGFYLITNVVL